MSIFVMILHCVPDLTLYDYNYLTFGLLQMPLRIAVPFIFLTSSFLFWKKIRYSENKTQEFGKRIIRWGKMYIFWAIVHSHFYSFQWWYPAAGVLWFLYALIIGNLIVFLFTRLIKNKYVLITMSVVLAVFCSLGDVWYQYVCRIQFFKVIYDQYYSMFLVMISGVTYGTLFGVIGYILVGFKDDLELKGSKNEITKLVVIFILFYALFAIEGNMTYQLLAFREFGIFLFIVPVVVSLFILVMKIDIVIPYSEYFRKTSSLIYYIHILFVYFYTSRCYMIWTSRANSHRFLYVFILSTWLATVVYLLSRKYDFIKNLF